MPTDKTRQHTHRRKQPYYYTKILKDYFLSLLRKKTLIIIIILHLIEIEILKFILVNKRFEEYDVKQNFQNFSDGNFYPVIWCFTSSIKNTHFLALHNLRDMISE